MKGVLVSNSAAQASTLLYDGVPPKEFRFDRTSFSVDFSSKCYLLVTETMLFDLTEAILCQMRQTPSHKILFRIHQLLMLSEELSRKLSSWISSTFISFFISA